MTDKQILGWVLGLAAVGTAVYVFYPKKEIFPGGVGSPGTPPTTTCNDENAVNNGVIATCLCKTGFSLQNGICVPIPPCTDENATNKGAAAGCLCKDGYFMSDGKCTPRYVPPATTTCNDINAKNNGAEGPCRCKPGYTLTDGICKYLQAGGLGGGYLGNFVRNTRQKWNNNIAFGI